MTTKARLPKKKKQQLREMKRRERLRGTETRPVPRGGPTSFDSPSSTKKTAMHASAALPTSLLSAEFAAANGLGEDDYHASAQPCDIVVAAGAKGSSGLMDAGGQVVLHRGLTPKQQKAAARVLEKKRKGEERGELLSSLEATSMPAEALGLLRSSRDMGKRETLKDKLRRALKEQRAGIPVSVDVDLEKTGPKRPRAGHDDGDGDDDDGNDANDGNGVHGSKVSREDQESRAASVRDTAPARDPEDQGEEAEAEEQPEVGPRKNKYFRRAPSEDEDGEETRVVRGPLASLVSSIPRIPAPAFHVSVDRPADVQEARLRLPILAEEQLVMEALMDSDVMVLCGETGSGKTTQVPQFLYEAGYGNPKSSHPGLIGITQPRRVATYAMAARVAHELNTPLGAVVGYQVRFDSRVAASTVIKFMTDGILLKEIESDFLLRRYSCIVIDEAHERNLYTDILIGLLSRIVPLRARMAAEPGATLAPLKLIVMSATLRVEDFVDNRTLFPVAPPLVRVDARQFPVTVHFARTTPFENYFNEAIKKVRQIHTRLPPGGILVFLTGKQEIDQFCKKLRKIFPPRKKAGPHDSRPKDGSDADASASDADMSEAAEDAESSSSSGAKPVKAGAMTKAKAEVTKAKAEVTKTKAAATKAETTKAKAIGKGDGGVAATGDDNKDAGDDDEEDEESFVFRFEDDEATAKNKERIDPETGKVVTDEGSDGEGSDGGDSDQDLMQDEDEDGEEGLFAEDHHSPPLHVIPLYAALSQEQQDEAFAGAPEGHRLVVVATNVAETSITLPGIAYVVDTGKAKERVYDLRSGMSRFVIKWISKSSAAQRQGRAGRVGPGHCYRLYSSAVFEAHFPEFSEPEILRIPIDGMMLQMKAMGIDKAASFPFPTPPAQGSLRASFDSLCSLGALERGTGRLTALGRTLSAFPLAPRFAKMLSLAQQGGCMPYVIVAVAALSSHHQLRLSVNEEAQAEAEADGDGDGQGAPRGETPAERSRRFKEARMMHANWVHPHSDVLTLIRVVGAYEYAGEEDRSFCERHMLPERPLLEIHHLRAQLAGLVTDIIEGTHGGAAHASATGEDRGADDAVGQGDGITASRDSDQEEDDDEDAEDGARGDGDQARRRKGDRPAAPGKDGRGPARRPPPSELRLSLTAARLAPPTKEQELMLRQIIIAGLIDRIAFRQPAREGGSLKAKGLVEYAALGHRGAVFIHPSSALFARAPEFVAFAEIVETTRPYMRNCTEVRPAWLAAVAGETLLSRSAPLEQPPPRFDDEAGVVVCTVKNFFGPDNWPLPASQIPYPQGPMLYKLFAQFFLEGSVARGFKRYASLLNTRPAAVLKSWNQKKIINLVADLRDAGVASREALENKWKVDKAFLLDSVLPWLDERHHTSLREHWPPTFDKKKN